MCFPFYLCDVIFINFQHVEKSRFKVVKFEEKILMTNTNVVLSSLIIPILKMVRINEVYNKSKHRTNMLVANVGKLMTLVQSGRISFAKEKKILINFLV